MALESQEWVEWTSLHEAIYNDQFGESDEQICARLGVFVSSVVKARRDVEKYHEVHGQVVRSLRDGVIRVLLPVNQND